MVDAYSRIPDADETSVGSCLGDSCPRIIDITNETNGTYDTEADQSRCLFMNGCALDGEINIVPVEVI